MTVSIIVSMSRNRAIGKNNRLPWDIPEDLKWFKKITYGHPVIMGRKTYESIGGLLPGRDNIIISKKKGYSIPGARVFNSIEDALHEFDTSKGNEVFIIGGEEVFHKALEYTDRIYLTLVHREFKGDTFFPEIPEFQFKEVFLKRHSGPIPFTITILERIKS